MNDTARRVAATRHLHALERDLADAEAVVADIRARQRDACADALAAGMSVSAVAQIAGLTRSTVYAWKQSK